MKSRMVFLVYGFFNEERIFLLLIVYFGSKVVVDIYILQRQSRFPTNAPFIPLNMIGDSLPDLHTNPKKQLSYLTNQHDLK